jgi:hypothetical protein
MNEEEKKRKKRKREKTPLYKMEKVKIKSPIGHCVTL